MPVERGRVHRFFFGKAISDRQVNFNKILGKTASVKSYPANSWGLYEMHGNVWEWCEDGHVEHTPQAVTDPYGALIRSRYVLRGGSWGRYSEFVRSAYRRRRPPDYRSFSIGFRLVLG